MLKTFDGAELFLARTRDLGVLDVRRTEGSPSILIFVRSELPSAWLDHIRVLARAQWPDASVVLAPRVSVRQTGTFARVMFHEDGDGDATDPRSGDSKTG